MFVRALSEEQIDRIHAASLAILERTGVVVPHDEVRRRFADSGARVDEASGRVRIPPDLVMRLVAGAGKRFAIYGRKVASDGAPAPAAEFGAGKRNYNSIAGEALWVERPGGERRYARLGDVATAARFADALDSITIAGAMADPQDAPVGYRCVAVFLEMLRATTKPVHFWFHDRASAQYLVEMLVALRGDAVRAARYPACYPFLEPISPLRFPYNGIDLLFATARLNLPVPVGPMAQMGLSAPATIAGTLAQENAEILAGICITQLVRPGMPVMYGGICHAFDMRTTQLIFSGPEQVIFGVALTQMGKRYGLPVYINVGLTDSKRPDAQAGLEAGISLVLGAAAGADIFGHMGISGVDQASSLDMLVLQDEVISFAESILRDSTIDDETLGLAEIDAAGPGGTFIDRDHTLRHFRRELWFPRLLDRDYYEQWRSAGALSTEDRCRTRVEHILATHEVPPLPEDVDRELARIVGAARRELGGS